MKNKKILFTALYLTLNANYTPAMEISNAIFEKKAAQSYSNIVDENLNKLGIDVNSIPKNSKKILAMCERTIDNDDYLLFFIYDENLFQEIKQVNITTKYASNEFDFKSATSSTKRYKTELVAIDSSGCIYEYKCKLEEKISQYTFREYTFGGMILENGTQTGYPFTATFNNNDYQFTIKDVITLNNTKCASIYLEQHNDIVQGYIGSKGKNNVMYGLSIDNYDVNKLEEIEFIYDLYNFEAVAYGDQYLWVERLLGTSNGFFDEEYINSAEFKKHGVTYTEDELKEISRYYPDYYQLIKAGISNTISNTSYETKTYGIFKNNTYKWDSIIKMDEIDKHTSKETAELIKKSFPDQQFVITIDSFDVIKKQDSLADKHRGEKKKAKLCQYLQQDMLHKYVGDYTRDPRYWWLKDKYDYSHEYPSAHTIYYCSQMPKNIEVVRMKFVDSKDNPYDLSVISTPVDVSEFTGDPEAEKPTSKHLLDWWNDFIKWLKTHQWIFYLILGVAAFFLILYLIRLISSVFD